MFETYTILNRKSDPETSTILKLIANTANRHNTRVKSTESFTSDIKLVREK